ncbi:LOW QUALITY PROTEIN: pre-miRNA 5'-monophosphate methyltransferase-like [Petromyzon marinus]|uniref:LOW QUALITY PROTEIN: pre-miRNA 5'-monophosphate methyltransferase-like n=1 Tax=Petromyzon marinus TaxID=7757 RepID=UPI003F70B698
MADCASTHSRLPLPSFCLCRSRLTASSLTASTRMEARKEEDEEEMKEDGGEEMAAPGAPRKREPGAAPHGNFINYAAFNPPARRVALLPRELLRRLLPESAPPFLALDVGCNSGELTVAVYWHLTGLDQPEGGSSGQVARVLPLSVLACDLDADLVERARGDNPHPEVIAYETFDFMDTAARDAALDAFLRRHGRARFDLCLCMSVTMWIHLHHGDAGLRRFLAAAARTATFLLVEPQPWRCYRAAARRLRRLGLAEFPLLPDLRLLRGAGGGGGRAEADELAALLGEEGDMRLLSSLGSTEWGRSLLLFGRTGVALGCIDKSTD